MARLRSLSPQVLEKVASQVADYLPADQEVLFGTEDNARTPHITEYMPIVTISTEDLDALRKNPPPPDSEFDLSKVLKETGLWHYQLTSEGEPTGYVQTSSDKKGSQRVRGVAITNESKAITAALSSIDTAAIDDSYEAVLLELPDIDVAGVAVVDRKNHKGSYVRVFRTPSATAPGIPDAPEKAAAFIQSILRLPTISGASFTDDVSKQKR